MAPPKRSTTIKHMPGCDPASSVVVGSAATGRQRRLLHSAGPCCPTSIVLDHQQASLHERPHGNGTSAGWDHCSANQQPCWPGGVCTVLHLGSKPWRKTPSSCKFKPPLPHLPGLMLGACSGHGLMSGVCPGQRTGPPSQHTAASGSTGSWLPPQPPPQFFHVANTTDPEIKDT